MFTPPQVAPAHSSSIIPVTMVTGSELSQTLMVQLPSQNEGKKPRVGQLRQRATPPVRHSYTLSHTPHTHTTHTHPLHIHYTSHSHMYMYTCVPYLYAPPTLILMQITHFHTLHTYSPHVHLPHTHTHTLTQVAPARSLPRSTRSGTTILVGCVTLVCPSHQN